MAAVEAERLLAEQVTWELEVCAGAGAGLVQGLVQGLCRGCAGAVQGLVPGTGRRRGNCWGPAPLHAAAGDRGPPSDVLCLAALAQVEKRRGNAWREAGAVKSEQRRRDVCQRRLNRAELDARQLGEQLPGLQAAVASLGGALAAERRVAAREAEATAALAGQLAALVAEVAGEQKLTGVQAALVDASMADVRQLEGEAAALRARGARARRAMAGLLGSAGAPHRLPACCPTPCLLPAATGRGGGAGPRDARHHGHPHAVPPKPNSSPDLQRRFSRLSQKLYHMNGSS